MAGASKAAGSDPGASKAAGSDPVAGASTTTGSDPGASGASTAADSDICRICLDHGAVPMRCRCTSAYAHDECMIKWIIRRREICDYSTARKCEVCTSTYEEYDECRGGRASVIARWEWLFFNAKDGVMATLELLGESAVVLAVFGLSVVIAATIS